MEWLRRKTKERKKKQSKNVGMLIIIIVSAILGFLIVPLSQGILKDFFEKFIYNDSFFIAILNVVLMVLIFLIGYLAHVFIHEAGHLLFGLISGYEFVSFRVGSYIIIKENGEFKLKRYNIPGTGGQCLMMPPEKKDGKFPFVIFNLGGVLLNLIVSLIAIGIATSIKELSWIKVILITSSAGGLFAAITNGIPLRIGGITNDAHNIMTMIKDEDSRDSFYLQLRVNGLLSKGIRIKDMEYDPFILKENMNYESPLNFARIFINHNYHLDNMDFGKAREALEFGGKYENDIIHVYKMELRSEKLFLELMEDPNSKKVDRLYNQNLKKYMAASKFMLNKKRIMMAYELLHKGNIENGLKHFEDLKLLAGNFPVKGEVDMEIMLGEYIIRKSGINSHSKR